MADLEDLDAHRKNPVPTAAAGDDWRVPVLREALEHAEGNIRALAETIGTLRRQPKDAAVARFSLATEWADRARKTLDDTALGGQRDG